MLHLQSSQPQNQSQIENQSQILKAQPNRFKKIIHMFFAFALAIIFMMSSMNAEAKRFGGGKSMGRQNSNAVQKYQQNQSNPQAPQNAQNRQNSQNAQSNQYGNSYSAAGQVQKPSMFGGFGKVLGGVAAALGLAWLASTLGIQDELMGTLGIALVIMLAFALIGWLKRRNQPSQQNAYATAGNSTLGANHTNYTNQNPNQNYSTQQSSPFLSQQNAQYGSTSANTAATGFASDFKPVADDRPYYARDFEQYAPQFFEDIQKLHQKGANQTLSQLLTPEMYQSFVTDSAQDPQQNNGSNTYLVRNLSAFVLDQYEENNKYYLSVLYQGIFYENDWQQQKNEESKINEIWQMVADKPTTSEKLVWRLDGITQISTQAAPD